MRSGNRDALSTKRHVCSLKVSLILDVISRISETLKEQTSTLMNKPIFKVKLSPFLTSKFAGRQTPETPSPIEVTERELTRQ